VHEIASSTKRIDGREADVQEKGYLAGVKKVISHFSLQE
jgi:hypothetical protein